ncbi:hypothetical protein L572_0998 [Bordetella bronchiseptica 345]|nr:hypothetical protein L572_0998 [Bordetella bronchiseptica 345]
MFELWQSMPSKMVFEIRVRHVSTKELPEFIKLASMAIFDQEQAADFEDGRLAEDPLAEHRSGLPACAANNYARLLLKVPIIKPSALIPIAPKKPSLKGAPMPKLRPPKLERYHPGAGCKIPCL